MTDIWLEINKVFVRCEISCLYNGWNGNDDLQVIDNWGRYGTPYSSKAIGIPQQYTKDDYSRNGSIAAE